MTTSAIGVDFGTTNSSIARASHSGEIELAQFPSLGAITDAYRSLLYLEQVKERGVNTLKSWTGPEGIERYLSAETKGRLIQSLKSFLSSRSLHGTEIFGRRVTLEDLIARILRDLREKAEYQFGTAINFAVVGRPVRFVGADKEDDNTYAEGRLKSAFQAAGYESVEFELEPVAAAHYYESTLDHDELILIGDFGGGTSDFSLVHVGPTIRQRGRRPADLLGNAGIGVAGDAFDSKIIRQLVSPALGAGSEMRSMDKILPVPSWVYSKLERWHHLSLLRAKEVTDMLKSVQAQAFEPKKIAALLHLIQEDLGYHLHRAVQKVKSELSDKPAAIFRFSEGSVELTALIPRPSFEHWIADELQQIERCVDSLLLSSGVKSGDVDMVFLTGGSSFVPAVRRIFETRFGTECIRAGNEFTSVARGLALKAIELQEVIS
ncbi:MAG TPA: Hsp70 family protein [Candidatus Angelobacter sp.]|nr:Hsp70 family protein [Candidatus Angelobacter sp.]